MADRTPEVSPHARKSTPWWSTNNSQSHRAAARGSLIAAASLGNLIVQITADLYTPMWLEHATKGLTTTAGRVDADPHHPFYDESICFTGTLLSMPRREAEARVVDVGCTFKNSVGKKLDYLVIVIGDGDFVLFADGHRTGKLDKAMQLREAGALIEIIPERDFLALLLS